MGQWKKIWNYIPVEWGTQIGVLEDLTQKVWVRNNLNGSQVKIRFCNLYDPEPLLLAAVTVGKWDAETKTVKEIQEVTYRGNREIRIQPGDSFYSERKMIWWFPFISGKSMRFTASARPGMPGVSKAVFCGAIR